MFFYANNSNNLNNLNHLFFLVVHIHVVCQKYVLHMYNSSMSTVLVDTRNNCIHFQ